MSERDPKSRDDADLDTEGADLPVKAPVRYVVVPREAGRLKTRLIVKMLERLNTAPDRVKFPKSDLR